LAVTGEIRDGLFVARKVELQDRSDNKIKAKAYDKAENSTSAADRTGIKLDEQVDIKLWFKDEDQSNRGDKLGDVVVKKQTFKYGTENPTTETTRYYYNQARMLEYIDIEEDDQDLEFTYDGLGRRIMVQRGNVDVVYQGRVLLFTPVETRKFVYLGGSVIRELDNDTPPNVLKEYIRGLELGGGIGGIIYQKIIPEEGPDRFYHYHYNHKGDVVALTDGDGNLAAYYEYDAWGNTMTEAEVSDVDNPYRYSTKEWDEKSGLYYFGARYYYPEAGRWT